MRPAIVSTFVIGAAILLAVTGCSSAPSGTAGGAPTTTGPTSSSADATPLHSADDLASALLAARDVPAGWRIYHSETSPSTTSSASAAASDPKCAPLLNEVKDQPRPLPPDQAEVEFDGGDGFKPPYIVENLHAYPSTAAAAAQLADQQQAVAACSRLQYTLDGRTSPVKVAAERAPSLKVPATGIRFTAQGGDLSGYDARIVTAQVDDVLVSLTFLSETEAQRNDVSTSAVEKVEKVLGTKG